MEKPIAHQNQQQQQQQVLKCPRCDSSNTKFCYYNNYSLSQPRHFCKACKRYWTRGGTLRNVPVGGGCRKNKRVKKPITTTSTHVSATSAPVVHTPNPNSNPNLDHIPSSTNNNSNHHLNHLFYGMVPQNPNYLKFDSRVSDVSGYELLQPHTNSLRLGFSSTSPLVTNHAHNSNSLVSSYPSMIGGGSIPSSTSAPTMASILASSLQQQQRSMGFAPNEDGGISVMKNMQMEGTQNRMNWNNHFHVEGNNDKIKSFESFDPNSLLWNTVDGVGGGWLDPTNNIGSSVHSLI